jgi:hypothetical protein
MRSSLRRQLLHLATDLSALVANPEDLGHGFDLLTRSYVTPVADAARNALRGDPSIAPLIHERYWGPWPGLRALLAQRCEEGWDRPLSNWQEQLGISELVARSPFKVEMSRV